MIIKKSTGQTTTERFLATLCERTFLGLWSFPNPYKSDRKELCDLLVIFEQDVFLFFDRESRKFDRPDVHNVVTWERWKREAVDKQIRTAEGAKRYLGTPGAQVYLETTETPLPIKIPSNPRIHKVVVAHGAKDACKKFSSSNVYGSLGICYGDREPALPFPFIVHLEKRDPIHVLDSHNLEIILGELDTVYDFNAYIKAKEAAIESIDMLAYCGEEDLLAHYFLNFDEQSKSHFIGPADKSFNAVMIGEGEWHDFVECAPYKRKKTADRTSYLWDDIIQRTCNNALSGTLLGNGNVFDGKSAIHEMAKEPRFSRRALADAMFRAIENFPDTPDRLTRNVSFMPSFYQDKAYIFLQLRDPHIVDYDHDYRLKRQALLQLACGVAKNKFPHLTKVIGIAIDAPKFTATNSEDFILLNCDAWPPEDATHYEQANKGINFFETSALRSEMRTIRNFPDIGDSG